MSFDNVKLSTWSFNEKQYKSFLSIIRTIPNMCYQRHNRNKKKKQNESVICQYAFCVCHELNFLKVTCFGILGRLFLSNFTLLKLGYNMSTVF